ncbi:MULTISPECIES: class I SAM-dependent methyltransferase [unclassified Sphingopyxis]|jgi:predicted methyltransferase|uniref:class I SAM-dependent methyltransferase n=1 Tax=unclassified Sphingopyxis TaxID=2614943 RepID=UPI0006C4B97A|nr:MULTISPECIES: class I SAM-dependent methyltransferase [unclassified Sphingopyxis]USI77925.1 class I SAM-dependent methyltransferase [Sphingopyxis sp. USTB-05]GAO79709.1 mlr5283 protein [Sphingopyxis sp. C-1]
MRNYRLLTPLVGAAMLVAVPVVAAAPDKAVAAAVADKSRLAENRKLDDGRHPADVLAFAQVKRGSTVADLLAGNGYYSEMLADLVGPKGTVIPMNPSGFHEPETWATITKAYPNIAPMVRPVNTIVLAPKSVDMIFTHLAYHDLYWQSEKFKFPRVEVDAMLVNWFSAVRPGGSIIVVDHVGPAGDTRELVEKLHRIDPAKVRADMERAGFVFDGDSGALRITADDHSKNVFDPAIRGKTDRFMMRFKKPA